MVAPAPDLLPAALAARLTEAQRQQVAETPRAQRLAALAAALGLDEPAALAALAGATGLAVVADPVVARTALPLLPARLAHDFQIIPLALPDDTHADQLHLATSWPPEIG